MKRIYNQRRRQRVAKTHIPSGPCLFDILAERDGPACPVASPELPEPDSDDPAAAVEDDCMHDIPDNWDDAPGAPDECISGVPDGYNDDPTDGGMADGCHDWATDAEHHSCPDLEAHDPDWDGLADSAWPVPDDAIPAAPHAPAAPTAFRRRLILIQ